MIRTRRLFSYVNDDLRALQDFTESLASLKGAGYEVLGELDIDSDKVGAFGADDRELLEAVAALLAPRIAKPEDRLAAVLPLES